MKTEKIVVNAPDLPEGGNALHITQAEIPMPIIVQRSKYEYSGNIHAPFEYYDGKLTLCIDEKRIEDFNGNPQYDKFDMVVEVNLEALKISFIENNHHAIETARVNGTINFPKELTQLGINTGKKYTGKELADTLQMNRLMFISKEENFRIVTALRNFKAKIDIDLENQDDLKGNKLQHYAQKIRQEYDLNFKLKWPVILGEEPVTFDVEINFDLRDKAVEFTLFSVEMKELQDEAAGELIAAEVLKFKNASVTVVQK